MEEAKSWSWCYCSTTAYDFAPRTIFGWLRNRNSVYITVPYANAPLSTLSTEHSSCSSVHYQTASDLWTHVEKAKLAESIRTTELHQRCDTLLPLKLEKKKNKKTIHEICSKGNQIYLCLKSVWCVTWSFNYARGTLPRGGKEINLDCGIINCKAIVPSTKPISYPFAVCSKALYKLKWVFFYLIIVFIYMNSKDIRKFCFISKQSHAFKFSCLSLNFSWLNQCRLFEAETRNRGSC